MRCYLYTVQGVGNANVTDFTEDVRKVDADATPQWDDVKNTF